MNASEKVVLFLSGGAMAGVFGAGVVTYLHKIGFENKISAIYAGSAGAFDAAYFLCGDPERGSRIYWENLPHHFLSQKGLYKGILQRISRHFGSKISLRDLDDALDMDYLFNVVKHINPIDIEKVIKSPIPFYVKIFNLDLKRIEYLDARRGDMFKILRASAATVPYTHETVKINGHKYIDGSIPEQIGYDTLRQMHPHEKIIFIYCGKLQRNIAQTISNYIEAKLVDFMFKDRAIADLYACSEQNLREDLRKIQNDPNAVLIYPGASSKTLNSTMNPAKLKQTWQIGFEKGKEIENLFIENQQLC